MINFEELLKQRAVSKVEIARKMGIERPNVNRTFERYNRVLMEIDIFLALIGTSLSSEISSIRDNQTNSQSQQRSSRPKDEAENFYSPYIEALQTIQKQADTIISQQRKIEELLRT